MGKALIIGNGFADLSFGAALHQAGYETTNIEHINSGWPGLSSLKEKCHDLVLVDEENLIADGNERLPALRHRTSAPIIVIGQGQEHCVVDALMQGADAYLSCTASTKMFLAQVDALMRRRPQPSAAF